MLLNPENYTYSRFKQYRKDGEEYGDSGPLYLAEHSDGTKLLVKQMNTMDTANEYLSCSIAQLLGINAPRAWLFSSHKQIKKISFRHSVGIEYFEDFKPATKEEFLENSHDAAKGLILNLLIDQEDGTEFGMHQNSIYTFDFSNTFTMSCYFGDRFLKMLESPSNELIQLLERRRDTYSSYLDSAIDVLSESLIAPEIMEEEYRNIRERYLTLIKNQDFEPILDEIGKLYPEAIVDFYRSILSELAYKLDKIPSIIKNSSTV